MKVEQGLTIIIEYKIETDKGELIESFDWDGHGDDAMWNADLNALVEVSSRCFRTMALGEMDCLIAECSRGSVLTTWLDEERSLLLGVVLNTGANIGMAKYRLTSTRERLSLQPMPPVLEEEAVETCNATNR